MNHSAISIQGLTKGYSSAGWLRDTFGWNSAATQAEVLRGVDLEIHSGEVFGLLGANGAGKTTLVEILATQLLPSSGEARICGHDVVRETNEVRKLAGYCPAATDSFFPRLSPTENLEFFALLFDLDPTLARRRIPELIEFVNLGESSRTQFQRLSHGMKQRLGLARALLSDPPVMLLDEPTRSLDPVMQREMHRFLRDTIRGKLGKTILLVTHSLEEAGSICDRVAILSGGRVAACGTVAEIVSRAGAASLSDAFAFYTGHPIAAQLPSEAQP